MQKNKSIGEITSKVLGIINDNRFKSKDQRQFIREYCIGVIDDITYTDDEKTIYDFYFDKILRNRHFDGEITEDDIRVIIKYFSKKKIEELKIKASFETYKDVVYTLKFGLISLSSCKSFNDGSSVINFRNSIFKKAIDKENGFNQENLFDIIELSYHEIIHAFQNDMICKQRFSQIESKNVLLWIKENIIADYDPSYYMKNYNNTFVERDACMKSKLLTIDTLRNHFSCISSIFLYEKEKETLEEYYDIHSKVDLSFPASNKRMISYAEKTDLYIDAIAKKHPEYIYNSLSIQYDKNGERRNEGELSDEYYSKKALLKTTYEEYTKLYRDKLKELEELYNYLILSAKEKEMDVRTSQINAKLRRIKF
ncbi:MAG: hypothetical protein PHT75_00590 [Bacilli bacterium]|nr:hypothetical protein [Bacilli bacterium]MDD3304614.1 hypothetical protein [Bacilli bacterium]MDD4053527.1 hypothetical protein [Bacilli bacterium]MDD4411506.1 hypothetical protein [Bacilli bacterium]